MQSDGDGDGDGSGETPAFDGHLVAHRQIVWLNFRNVLRCGHSQETGKLFPLMRN